MYIPTLRARFLIHNGPSCNTESSLIPTKCALRLSVLTQLRRVDRNPILLPAKATMMG